jgi:hypothetical protein
MSKFGKGDKVKNVVTNATGTNKSTCSDKAPQYCKNSTHTRSTGEYKTEYYCLTLTGF